MDMVQYRMILTIYYLGCSVFCAPIMMCSTYKLVLVATRSARSRRSAFQTDIIENRAHVTIALPPSSPLHWKNAGYYR